jgi:hypothetical protein
MPAPGTRALIDVALDTFGLFARSNRRPVRKIADEQPPAPGFEPIIEREALAAVSPNLDAEPDHFVVLENGSLAPLVVTDFTKRSVNRTRMVCYPYRTTPSQAGSGPDSKML